MIPAMAHPMTYSPMQAAKKIACAALLVFLMITCAAWLPAHAQQPPAAPDQSNSSEARGPGGQIAHESNEAAGEEKDENEQFKHSASVQRHLSDHGTESAAGLLGERRTEFCRDCGCSDLAWP